MTADEVMEENMQSLLKRLHLDFTTTGVQAIPQEVFSGENSCVRLTISWPESCL